QAKAACDGGKADVNGARARPHREVHPGDRVSFARGDGARLDLVVRGLAERSVPKAQAQLLYPDVTPPPSAERLEVRRLDRLLGPRRESARPDARERRERRRRKERSLDPLDS